MIRVGIVGGTGYTGVELLRILALHPEVQITAVTSRADAGTRIDVVYPHLRGYCDLQFSLPELDNLKHCQVVFFATPNGIAMTMAKFLLALGIKVIDLSADFRLKDLEQWQHWYGMTHNSPELIAEAVYGLPEVNRAQIKTAKLIACPGCYPTAVQLGFLPLLSSKAIASQSLIADVKSGVSGAGRKAELALLMSEAGESFKSYAVAGHRHLPEIVQGLQCMSEAAIQLTFVPHLVPMIRGIHATLYAKLLKPIDLQELFEQYYQNDCFVDVLPAGSHADTRNVRGSNRCQLAVHQPQAGDTVVILSVIDNLVKGASGQAIQCMNLICDLPESLGLHSVALYP